MNKPGQLFMKMLSALTLTAFAAAVVVTDPGVQGASATATAAEPGAVSVEKTDAGTWKVINKYGDFVGTLKSDTGQVFQLYDTANEFMGKIIESGIWYPRQYRSRDTKVIPREAYLYLDALEAIKIIQVPE